MCLLKIPKGEASHQLAGSLDSTKYCGIFLGTDENRVTVYRLEALSEKNNRKVPPSSPPLPPRERESWRERASERERERASGGERERERGGEREKLIVSGLDL